MTKEAIEFNLYRLTLFLGDRHNHKVPDEYGEFIKLCEHIMDYHGAGRDQYTLLLLAADDYSKFKHFASDYEGFKTKEDFRSDNLPTGPSVFQKGYITFRTDSYIWWVKEIEAYPEYKK